MKLVEKLILNFNELDNFEQKEVIDFVEFLIYKKRKKLISFTKEISNINPNQLEKPTKK